MCNPRGFIFLCEDMLGLMASGYMEGSLQAAGLIDYCAVWLVSFAPYILQVSMAGDNPEAASDWG